MIVFVSLFVCVCVLSDSLTSGAAVDRSLVRRSNSVDLEVRCMFLILFVEIFKVDFIVLFQFGMNLVVPIRTSRDGSI